MGIFVLFLRGGMNAFESSKGIGHEAECGATEVSGLCKSYDYVMYTYAFPMQ